MRKEKSCGAVIFRFHQDVLFFLLLKYKNEKNYWGLSKGHVENNESEMETARREILEETGIKNLVFLPNFRETIAYFPAVNLFKEVVFFLVQTQTEKIQLISGEHTAFAWLGYQEALQRITYEKDRQVLQKAYRFMEQLMTPNEKK